MTAHPADDDATEGFLAHYQVATCDYGDEGVDARIQRLLEVLRTFLRMDVVFVGRVEHGLRHIEAAAQAAGAPLLAVGHADPLEQTWCHQILLGRVPPLVPDAAALQASGVLPPTALPVGTFLSVPLRLPDGRLHGTLCCLAREVVADLPGNAVHHLTTAARLLGDRLAERDRQDAPALAAGEGFAGATAFFASSAAMEPLRAFLAQVRNELGMELAFISQLTEDDQVVFRMVDADAQAGIPLAEGHAGPAADTYCRLLAEGRLEPVVHDALAVPHLAALPVTHHMGIRSYVSSAIRLGSGRVVGTVCCFSREVQGHLGPDDQQALQAIADAIAVSIRPDGRLKTPIWPGQPA